MTPAQRKAHKAGNRLRRDLPRLAHEAMKRIEQANRRRFEEAHDQWRRAVGLAAIARDENS
jgi:hypothetical protein